jgi:hypothetical protein
MYAAVAALAVVVFVVALVAARSLQGGSYDIALSMQRVGGAALYPYQTAYFSVNVRNDGGRRATSLPIAYYVNGVERNFTHVTLDPGHNVTLMFNYTYTRGGSYLFQAVADPGNLWDIRNRSSARAGVYANATQPQPADEYESIPNRNITYTESMSGIGAGIYSLSAIAQLYNISGFTNITGLYGPVTQRIYEDIYGTIANENIAYAHYSNGTSAYAAWIQGTLNPVYIAQIVASFNRNVRNVSRAGGGIIYYSMLSNSVSLCATYSGGWTKLVEYSGLGGNQTCVGLALSTYNATEGNTLVGLIRSNATLARYRASFGYSNSNTTQVGDMLTYDGRNLTLTNLFQNNYGLFVSGVERYATPLNLSAQNSTCAGLIYTGNGTSLCSYVLLPRSGQLNYSYYLIRSVELGREYGVSMYSLVAAANLQAAHFNAGELVSRLGINQTTLQWSSLNPSTCALEQGPLSCGFDSFNYTNDVARINLTNSGVAGIRLDSAACAVGGGFAAEALNSSIAGGNTISLYLQCHNIPLPGFVARTSYLLSINYTVGGTAHGVNGTLNVTNLD